MSRLPACARGSTTRRHRPRNAAALDADLRELIERLAVGKRRRPAHLRVGLPSEGSYGRARADPRARQARSRGRGDEHT
jgi:hypothetical protein